ncbi:MAG TPA: SCO1664 family protein [Acidimicrobiales bacterium]|nr:SCO1664 family protein [Acidimicrobiales bacterium]
MSEDERPPAPHPLRKPGEAEASPDVLTALSCGDIDLEGRLPWSSNATFLVTVTLGGHAQRAVYKPYRGERPLWDFPDGLYHREAAAYQLSVALGWELVPETVLRSDGPLGVGSLQRFVPANFDEHYFTLLEDERHHGALRRIAAFDLVANNADRKSGHCLLGEDGHIWAIDNALCFHSQPKLRTVIWDFGGEPIPDHLMADLGRLAKHVPRDLRPFLTDEECEAVGRRAAAAVRNKHFPSPGPERRAYPWPLV